MKTLHLVLLFAFLVSGLPPSAQAAESPVVLWDFDAVPDSPDGIPSPPPSLGFGQATLLGGVTGTLTAGVPGADGGRAWNTTRFPAQGRSTATAGVRFAASTTGWEALRLQFQHRFSARSSGRAVVRVSVNGVDFEEVASYAPPGADLWTNVVVDLRSLAAVSDNAAVVFDVVSAFGPGTNRYVAAGPGSSYSTAGTWRFDAVTLLGEPALETPAAPRIRVSPADRVLTEGDALRLGVGGGGTEPLDYQWLKDGEDIPGETGPILVRETVTAALAGRYRVRVSNSLGTVLSDDAAVTVNPLPPPYVERTCAALHGLVVGPEFAWPDDGPLAALEGVVISHANLTAAGHPFFFLQDATGGIAISWRGQSVESLPPAGARVRVVGPVLQSDGLLQVAPVAGDPVHSLRVLEEGVPLPEPVELDLEWLSDAVRMESLEGRRVRVSGVTVDTGSPLFPARGANVTLTSVETGASAVLRVEGDSKGAWVDLAGQPKPSGPFTVTGVWSQDDASRPYTQGYRLVPTRYADLVPAGYPPDLQWTVIVEKSKRLGDSVTNAFSEPVLRPGETLRLRAEFSEDAGELQPADGIVLPDGATLNWVTASDSGNAVQRLMAEVVFTATEAHAGLRQRIQLRVAGPEAVRRGFWTVYVPTAEERQVVLTEILANPAARPDLAGFNPLQREDWPPLEDATLSSRISAWDEFVELVNLGPGPVSLGGWTLSDATRVQAWIPPEAAHAAVPVGGALVVYGGPPGSHPPRLTSPAMVAELAGGASAGTDGLGLNNSGDTLLLRNNAGDLVERLVFSTRSLPAGVSLVRWPLPEGPWVAQTTLDPDRKASPGTPPVGGEWPGAVSAESLTVRVWIDGGQVRLEWERVPNARCSVREWDPAAGWKVIADGMTEAGLSVPLEGNDRRLFQVTSP